VTAQARISQADVERVVKGATTAAEKMGKTARVIFRLEAREIEVIVSEIGSVGPANEWDDE